jgi:hypothetical protein
MTGFDATYYEALRGRVRGVLIRVSESLPPGTATLVEELIDANESGEALIILCEAITDAEAAVDGNTLEDIVEISRIMGLEPDPTRALSARWGNAERG